MKIPGQSYTRIPLWLFSVFTFDTTWSWILKQAAAFDSNNVSKLTIGSAISFFWLIVIVGGSIILTLLYVGWKKYKAEKRKQEREKE